MAFSWKPPFLKSDDSRMQMIQGIRPTSKAALKMQCLMVTKCDVEEARKLYEFFAQDMASLPDYDPPERTWVDSTKATLGDAVSWLKDNQNAIATGYEIVRQMTGGRLPALVIPTGAADAAPAAAPLPDINV